MTTVVEAAPSSADRRLERRVRTLKTARIAFNFGRSVFDCTLRNLSPSGALLEVASTAGIPSQFEILVPRDGIRRTCTVRWMTQRLMGVHFDDAAQKAA